MTSIAGSRNVFAWTRRGRCGGGAGFTLIEMAIAVVIIGALLTVGLGSWRMFVESREIAKVRSQLRQVKQCLIRRAVWSERYPSFQGAAVDCDNPLFDVDVCLCEAGPDEWNGEIRYVAGVVSGGDPANGQFFVDDPAKGQERVRLDGSEFVDHNGEVVQDVAFLLVSYGENGQPFDAGYFGNQRIVEMQLGNRPSFADNDDDIFVFATSRELIAAVRNQ